MALRTSGGALVSGAEATARGATGASVGGLFVVVGLATSEKFAAGASTGLAPEGAEWVAEFEVFPLTVLLAPEFAENPVEAVLLDSAIGLALEAGGFVSDAEVVRFF